MSAIVNIQYSAPDSSGRGYYSQSDEYNYMSYVGREDAHREPEFIRESESEYFFNHLGRLHRSEVNEIRNFLRTSTGTIWYGVFDTDKAHADRLDSIMKAAYCVESVFPKFFDSIGGSGMDISNLHFFCALHTDTKDHPHVHFAFAEKEKKYYSNTGELCYRQSSKLPEESLKLLRNSLNAYFERPRILNLDELICEAQKLNSDTEADHRAIFKSLFVSLADSAGADGIGKDELFSLIYHAKSSSDSAEKAFNSCFKTISSLSGIDKENAKKSVLSSISGYLSGFIECCDERKQIEEIKTKRKGTFGDKKLLKFIRVHKRKAEREAERFLNGFPEFMKAKELEIRDLTKTKERSRQKYRY